MRKARGEWLRTGAGGSKRGLGFALVYAHKLGMNFFLLFPENPGLHPRACHSCSRDPLTKD
jgi:hypothetical protein